MKITVYECDKCHNRFNNEDDMAMDMFGIADICTDCFKVASVRFINWLEGSEESEESENTTKAEPVEAVEEAAEPVKEKKAKKIDWNKACALKEAGWSHKAISEELGIESGTLNSGTFYKKIEQYKQGIRF